MGSVRLDAKIKEQVCQVAASEELTLSEKTSRYDDSFYDDIFGAVEGPADLFSTYRLHGKKDFTILGPA